jgi:hypothetical protein
VSYRKKEKDGVPNRKQEEGWSSEKETRRRLECLIGNKKMDGVPNRKQGEGWSA